MQYSFTEFITFFFYGNVVLGVVCATLTLATWTLLPRWRSLQNYISAMQVLLNSVLVCIVPLEYYPATAYCASVLIVALMDLSLLWSICASLLAFIKLVLLHHGKISGEKRYATMFCFGTTALVNVYTKVIATSAFDILPVHSFTIDIWIMYYFMLLNLTLYIKIVATVLCCRNTEFPLKKLKSVVSLICVGLICDLTTVVYIIVAIFIPANRIYGLALYPTRLLTQAIFVLCRKSTRNMWSAYLQK